MNKNKFTKSIEGQTVYARVRDEWIEGKVTCYIGHGVDNPTMDLVEVASGGFFRFGGDYHEVFKIEEIRFDDPNKPQPVPEIVEGKLPSWAVGWCHYCGMPANTFGFFDEPVCRGCGG